MPAEADFSAYAQTKIDLFIANPLMRKHANLALNALGFINVTDHQVPTNYFQAINRVIPVIAGSSEIVLLNLPSKPRPSNSKDDVDAIYDQIHESYTDIKTYLSKRNADPLKVLSKAIPMVEVGDYLREKLVEILFKFRVPAAFFMSIPSSTRHLKGKRKDDAVRENFQLHFQEISQYLGHFFRDREQLMAMADEKLSERELNQRKKEYDSLMAEAAKRREDGAYEAAIDLYRKAIEVFPKDIEAYLESGRLYVRRKEYGRALIRFGQAEDLFQDAPAPNKEIANVRMTQVKEKIEAGADPNSSEVMELLNDAVANYNSAHEKAVDMQKNAPERPELATPMLIGQEIIKWDMSELLGPKHPAVKALMDVANKSTEGLNNLPLSELSTMQCLTLGLQSLEKGDVAQARKYYFHALKDKTHFSDVCTEINYMGIRLRKKANYDEAIDIYLQLVKYNPPNLGSVFWNTAVAYAFKNDTFKAAGFAARCLYIDPYIAREDSFYESMTPQLAAIMLKLMKALRHITAQSKSIKPPAPFIKLYQAHNRLIRLIMHKKRDEALVLFLQLAQKAPKFIMKPEFYGDGIIPQFLRTIQPVLARNKTPRNLSMLKLINGWLKYTESRPLPATAVQYLKFLQSSTLTMEDKGDQAHAAFYMGQALMIMPIDYFDRPDFFSRENLPELARELAVKHKYVEPQRFPKTKPTGKSKPR